MLIANMRTPAGLVNGALGTLVAVILRPAITDKGGTVSGGGASPNGLTDGVSASNVEYAVVDFPKYTGPVIYRDHPTWVPVEPFTQRHKHFKGF